MHVRVKQQSESAHKIAQYLAARPEVEQVMYPGLPTHPNHDVAKAEMALYGGMMSFTMRGGLDAGGSDGLFSVVASCSQRGKWL